MSPYFSNQEITRHLERMLDSPDFRASPQQVAFLKFIVDQVLSGNTGQIKAYTVATEVFGRGPDFDQSNDPIVSVQASGLRRALERYYASGGKHDSIRIDIPKGAYVPVFEKRPEARTTDRTIDRRFPDIRIKSTWPAVLVRPLSNFSGNPEFDFWGVGLATELADELYRYPDIRVMTANSKDWEREFDQTEAQFVIGGTVRSDENCIKMTVQLTSTRTGRLIWSESCRSPIEAPGILALQEEFARQAAVKIAGERGWIAKSLDISSKRHPPQHSDVYEAVLRYYEYDLTMTPAAFSRALTALQKAVAIDPDCGPAWSMLARLFAEIYVLDIAGFEDPLARALEYGRKGVRLLPEDKRSRAMLACVHVFRSDLPTGLAEAERALNLQPQSLFMLDAIGYLMTLMGAWERGPALIEKIIRMNPFYSNCVHLALWLNCLRQKNYAAACREAMKLNRPALFWDHLARASAHGLLGNIEDGRQAAAELLNLTPDFAERGRMLIGRYIKFEDIAERIIQGLTAVGIAVE